MNALFCMRDIFVQVYLRAICIQKYVLNYFNEIFDALFCISNRLLVKTECGHGGHAEHVKEWFETNRDCPTGCGCRCGDLDLMLSHKHDKEDVKKKKVTGDGKSDVVDGEELKVGNEDSSNDDDGDDSDGSGNQDDDDDDDGEDYGGANYISDSTESDGAENVESIDVKGDY